jgi:soluble lytic murein transglycosylase-like protein
MATSIQQLIAQAAAKAGVPASLALAQAQQESSLNPNAYNPKSGATGLFQLEPATAAQLGVTNPLDPVQSAAGGTSYLAQLYNQFGSWDLALAAYDWGPGNLSKAVAMYGSSWLAHAPAETQNYVATILGNAGVSASSAPSAVSVTAPAPADSTIDVLAPAPDPFDTVDAGSAAPSGFILLTLGLIAAYIAWDFLSDG